MTSDRINPKDSTKLQIWGAAAGRCHLCNRPLIGNDDLGALVAIGEVAHIVGATDAPKSPRGQSELSLDERAEFDNLLLLCGTCHKPADDGGMLGKYTVELLRQCKIDHEKRVELVTGVDPSRGAHVVRLVGNVRGKSPELSFETVQSATLLEKMFPRRLPDVHRSEIEIDLRLIPDEGTPAYYAQGRASIDRQVRRINQGIASGDVKRLAIFGVARIPLLVYFGAQLDDKIKTHSFQLHRNGGSNDWSWAPEADGSPDFEVRLESVATGSSKVALIVNTSGTISIGDLPDGISTSCHVYIVEPEVPAKTGPELFTTRAVLTNFSRTIREFLAQVERDHGRVAPIALFGAVPVSAAIELGRVLMPNVSPGWLVYDRNESSQFEMAMEVVR